MKTALDPRHLHRRKIVQELFAWNAHPKNKLSAPTSREVVENRQEIDEVISQAAPEWEIDKINSIDLAILRLAVFELVIEHKEPPKAIIDEAIELAKEFAGDSSSAFINGALGKVIGCERRILRMIADKLGVEESRLGRQAHLKSDLNASDLEIADLITSLERDLNITIDQAERLETVGDILDLIEEQI